MIGIAEISPQKETGYSEQANITGIKYYRSNNRHSGILTVKAGTKGHQRNAKQKKNIKPQDLVIKVDDITKHAVVYGPVLPDNKEADKKPDEFWNEMTQGCK